MCLFVHRCKEGEWRALFSCSAWPEQFDGDYMNSHLKSCVVLVAVMSAGCSATPQSTPTANSQNVLPKPEQLFTDAKIGRTFEESKPGTIALTKAPAGAPNVLLIL